MNQKVLREGTKMVKWFYCNSLEAIWPKKKTLKMLNCLFWYRLLRYVGMKGC